MLKQVQHDSSERLLPFRHPEPCPELDSGSVLFRDLEFVHDKELIAFVLFITL